MLLLSQDLLVKDVTNSKSRFGKICTPTSTQACALYFQKILLCAWPSMNLIGYIQGLDLPQQQYRKFFSQELATYANSNEPLTDPSFSVDADAINFK